MTIEAAQAGEAAAAAPALFTPGYRRYVLGLLVVVYAFSFIDRQILAILLEPIKRDLGLSDSQLGFLGGIAFALFYTTLGVPIARWADRANRRNIIALAVAVWSGMTALCGLAQNFWQLMLARIGVGVGEAGGGPPAHSLLADYFPPESRATALAIYAIGIPLGILGGLMIGGWANEFIGWRATFLLVGLPGLLIALLVRFTIAEPPRGHSEGLADSATPPLRDVLGCLWRMSSFRWLTLGASAKALFSYALMIWMPAFFIRVHGLSSGEVGTWLGLIIGIAGGLGTYLAGRIADRLAQKDKRWYAWVPGIAVGLLMPTSVLTFLIADTRLALVCAILPNFLNTMYVGPVLAAVQGLADLRMRAMASAIFMLILSAIGLGLGPLVTGILSDLLQPRFGLDALRYAMVMVSFAAPVGAFCFWMASRNLRHDLVWRGAPVARSEGGAT